MAKINDFKNGEQFGPTPNYPMAIEKKPEKKIPWICIGGPCSIESQDQIDLIFDEIGPFITHLRGGVFRAGTYPSKSYGWKWNLLKRYWYKAQELRKPNIVDVLDIRDLDQIDPYCDVFQVGSRQSQHYALLKELGKQDKPVIIKRGQWQTASEFLGSAEYILSEGNENVILCERGGITHLDHVRYDISISMISKLKQVTNLPIIIDASHGTGDHRLVRPVTLAGIAAGADGCLVETHFSPKDSLSDAQQAVGIDVFKDIALSCKELKDSGI